MTRNWTREFLSNFFMFLILGIVSGLTKEPSDVLWAAVMAAIWTSLVLANPPWLVNPSRRVLQVFAWLQTGMALFLLALAFSASAQLTIWHTIGGIYRSGPVWAIAAAGWAILAGLAWRKVILSNRPRRVSRAI